jgi:CDP-paratose 2-epimerase
MTALITGGAGFIGTNLADRLMCDGHEVLVFDDLSRPGVRGNLAWLSQRYGDRLRTVRGDVRDFDAVCEAVSQVDQVFHLAAQVAVTTSLRDPRTDFLINAQGTLNVLEAVRRQQRPPPLLFTSTNKVYGPLTDVPLTPSGSRYIPLSREVRRFGIDEQRLLDFHSPYGCSKGAADQYVLDYARSYGLPAVVFRMSCIYGPHQQGNEDQGWVAHFLICARDRAPLTVFGDGLQVRDVLYVDDLVEAQMLAMQHVTQLAGRAFNIGGGTQNTLSLLELISWLGQRDDRPLHIEQAAPRVGDQRYYVSNTAKFSAAVGWHPRVSVADGLTLLSAWLNARSESAPPLPADDPLVAHAGARQ